MKVQFVGIWRGCVCHPLTYTHTTIFCTSPEKDTFPTSYIETHEKVSKWNENGQFAAGRSHHSSVLKIIVEPLQHLCSLMLVSHFWSSSTLSAVSFVCTNVLLRPSDIFSFLFSHINHKIVNYRRIHVQSNRTGKFQSHERWCGDRTK